MSDWLNSNIMQWTITQLYSRKGRKPKFFAGFFILVFTINMLGLSVLFYGSNVPSVGAATSATLFPNGQGTYTAWIGDEDDIDETGTPDCVDNNTDGNDNVATSTTGNRESVLISLSSIPDGSTITSVNVVVTYRNGNGSGDNGTFQTSTRLNGTDLDSGTNLIATNTTCTSGTQTINVADAVKSGVTTLEVGVLKTATDTSEVYVGTIRAVVTYTLAPTPTPTPTPTTVTICHATGNGGFVQIVTSSNAVSGHFDNNGTPNQGHEEDLLFQGEVPCPSPTPTPTPTATPTPTPTPTPTVDPTVTPTVTPTATPFPAPVCAVTPQTINAGDIVFFSATDGDGTYAWTTSANGTPFAGAGSTFSTTFALPGSEVVTVTSDNQSGSCLVTVNALPTPTPTPTATPTPTVTPDPTIDPTPSPTPSNDPTPTPTPTPTPVPSAEPTPSPTPDPTATPTPSPSPSPSVSPSPTPTYTLTLTTSGDGNGVVTGAGINCDSNFVESEEQSNNDCTETYDEGTEVTLTATPDTGSNFDSSWATTLGNGGTCSTNTTPCIVTMNGNVTIQG